MDYKNKIDEVLSKISTVTDRAVFIEQIDLYLEAIYKPELLKQSVSRFANLIDNFISNSNQKVEMLSQLRTAVAQMNIMEIVIAYEPRVIDIEKITMWVKANMGVGVIIDLKVDSGIVGGAKLNFAGKYIDESLLTRVNLYWKSHGVNWFKLLGINL